MLTKSSENFLFVKVFTNIFVSAKVFTKIFVFAKASTKTEAFRENHPGNTNFSRKFSRKLSQKLTFLRKLRETKFRLLSLFMQMKKGFSFQPYATLNSTSSELLQTSMSNLFWPTVNTESIPPLCGWWSTPAKAPPLTRIIHVPPCTVDLSPQTRVRAFFLLYVEGEGASSF
jgi:hypothetical protein